MEDKRAIIKDKVSPDLLVSPHIVSELLHVVMGEWQPESSQQEQLVVHLTECEYCRTALVVLLSADQEYEMATNSSTETPARNLLTQFVTIHHEIAIQDFEQMGAYAEAIKAVGRKEADKRFLVLAEHIRKCASCRAWLEETLAFLNESEEND
jgi:predicted anti-sigma-YlaC factor YlaD